MKWTVTLSTLCLALLTGCEGVEPGGTRTFSEPGVPFTFQIPAEFTDEEVDGLNSRGDVVAVAAITKVDVVAVRRLPREGAAFDGPRRHEVLGQEVTSELREIEGFSEYVLECQYTAKRADDVREACRTALESVRRR